MDCCSHEGRTVGDARFEIKKVADGVHAAVAAPAYKVNSNTAIVESDDGVVTTLRPALPTIAFEQTMKLYRRDREIHLLFLGRAHTEGDVFVYLPKEKVVITGDAVIGWTPFMGDGYPEDWVATVDRLAQLDFTQMSMGHGDVAGRDWLAMFRSYIHDLVDAVREQAAAGATLEDVQQRVPERRAGGDLGADGVDHVVDVTPKQIGRAQV